jgi:hypothetical protein
LPPDLSEPLLVLMERLTDSADDDDVGADFCAAFDLNKTTVRPGLSVRSRLNGALMTWAQVRVRSEAVHI